MRIEEENELHGLEQDPHTPREALKRIKILLLSIAGRSPTFIAEIIGCNPNTAYKSIHEFNKNGVASIFSKERPVRSPMFTLEIEVFVTELVSSETEGWNTRIIAEKINEKFKGQLPAPLKVPTVYANLRRMGLTWQRSRFIPAVHKRDPIVYEETKTRINGLKRGLS
jgi:transposase